MYKGFALAVLLIAPILVMLADSIAPKHDAPAQAAAAPADAASTPASTGPKGAIPHLQQAQATSQTLGQGSYAASAPLSEAGKPMLDLTQGIDPTPTIGAPTAPTDFASAEPVANPNAAAFAQLTAEWQANRR